MVAKPVRVSYANGAAALNCTVIANWSRGEITPISGSSGLKDYFRNEVWSVFEGAPHINRIVILRANGPMFAVFHTAAGWYDVAAERVIVAGTDVLAGGRP